MINFINCYKYNKTNCKLIFYRPCTKVIGKNVTIYQQVTIGSNNLKGSKGRGYPVIGNDCLIGVGSVIIYY